MRVDTERVLVIMADFWNLERLKFAQVKNLRDHDEYIFIQKVSRQMQLNVHGRCRDP